MSLAREQVQLLPEGYDPRTDQGREAVQVFLWEDRPPDRLMLEQLEEGQWVVRAQWDTP